MQFMKANHHAGKSSKGIQNSRIPLNSLQMEDVFTCKFKALTHGSKGDHVFLPRTTYMLQHENLENAGGVHLSQSINHGLVQFEDATNMNFKLLIDV